MAKLQKPRASNWAIKVAVPLMDWTLWYIREDSMTIFSSSCVY